MKTLVENKEAVTHVDVPCVICENTKTRPVYSYFYGGKSSEIRKCINCGHMVMFPVPLVNLNDRNMDTLPDAEFFGKSSLKTLHEHIVINKEIRYVKSLLNTQTPRLLDIGCGTGWTTSIWQKNGFTVTGLEPSVSRSQVARDVHKLIVSNEHLENFTTTELFDVIVLRHLLEHIEEPAKMLTKIKSFLKPNGLLLIVIPNIDCIGRHIFKENWEWILPWHLHFYTPGTLGRLLEKCGYEKCKIYQMPSPLWYPHALNKALLGENSKFRLPTFIALPICLPIVLLGALLNLNDNMTLIFKNSKRSISR